MDRSLKIHRTVRPDNVTTEYWWVTHFVTAQLWFLERNYWRPSKRSVPLAKYWGSCPSLQVPVYDWHSYAGRTMNDADWKKKKRKKRRRNLLPIMTASKIDGVLAQSMILRQNRLTRPLSNPSVYILDTTSARTLLLPLQLTLYSSHLKWRVPVNRSQPSWVKCSSNGDVSANSTPYS